jgi:hypothetical protein
VNKVFVYRVRPSGGSGDASRWGTLEAILAGGFVPITRSARRVDPRLLEAGFLPSGVSPFDLSDGLATTAK